MTTQRESSRGIWMATLGLVAVLAVGGFFAWRVTQDRRPEAPKAEAPAAEAPKEGPKAVNLAEGDAMLRAAGGELSADELLALWLAEPDLVRRLVAATFQVSRGESPRELLGFLKPSSGFTVDEVEDKTTLAPAPKVKPKGKATGKQKARRQSKYLVRSYMSRASAARYDPVARVLGSIDTAKLGALYARLSPYTDMAMREAAPPGKTLGELLGAAVDHLAKVPISDEPLELVELEEGVGYGFKDPALEALTPAQKHLLRMGPANARVVVKKLEDFRTAIFGSHANAGLKP